jgi:hypothetical protein
VKLIAGRDLRDLEVEEAAAILSARQFAALELAEDVVAAAGGGTVGTVADEFRWELEQKREQTPACAELLEHEQDGIGAREHELWRPVRIAVEDNIQCVEVGGTDVVAGKDAGGKSALQRCEAEGAVRIATENELDEAMAEAADTVVENDGVGHECGRHRRL